MVSMETEPQESPEEALDKEKDLEESFMVLSEPLREFFNRVQDLREDYTATGDDGKIDQITGDIRDKYLDGLSIKDYFNGASDFDLEKLVKITLDLDDPEEFKDILMLDDNQDLLLLFKQNISFIQNRPKTELESPTTQ